jgi:exosortase E/protease (VPEID-CTERM system)
MPTRRRALLAALLPAEVLLLTLSFEPSALSTQSWAEVAVRNAAILPRLAIAFAAALILLLSPHWQQVRAVFTPGHATLPVSWMLANAAAFGLLYGQTAALFSGRAPVRAGDALLWLLGCVAVAVTWGLCLAPGRSWREFLRQNRVAIAASVGCAVVTWMFTLLVRVAWESMADATLALSRGALAHIYPDARYDAVSRKIWTSHLTVEIAPECSGYEGIAMVTVFVAIYLWLFRRQLAFPRAFWLLPIGWLAIWLANVVRIVVIVVIGAEISPQVATQGFHSQAGWIAFTAIALGLVALSHRSGILTVEGAVRPAAPPRRASAMLVPFMVLMAASMVFAAFSEGFGVLEPLAAVAAAIAVWRFRGEYRVWPFQFAARPVVIGLATAAAWVVLVGPPPPGTMKPLPLEEWPFLLGGAWLLLRLAESVLIVPLVEEIAFRGYLLRMLRDGDFESPEATRFAWMPFLVSSILFGLMHSHWIAAMTAGAAFALAFYYRGRVADAIVAHVVANGIVAALVLSLGWWHLWA